MAIKTASDFMSFVKDNKVEIIDLKFIDVPGLWQHFSVSAEEFGEEIFEEGIGFDGSSIRGFQTIDELDMLLIPDATSAFLDPFSELPTISLTCNVRDPVTGQSYTRDPRFVAQKAENYLKSTGVADLSYWGPEIEFYVFDNVRFDQSYNYGFYYVDSEEGFWNSGQADKPNLGYKPRYKEGYFPVPPMDHLQDIRSEMMRTLEKIGVRIEVHHHEVGTAGQCEIDMRYTTLTRMADQVLMYKYVIKNVGPARQDRNGHAEAALSRQRLRHAHAPEPVEIEQEHFLRPQQLRAHQRDRPSLYRRHIAACPCVVCIRGADDELLSPAGARLRGADQYRLFAAQSERRHAHPDVFAEREGQTPRVPHARPELQSLFRLLRHADGRPRRHRQ